MATFAEQMVGTYRSLPADTAGLETVRALG